MTNAIQEAITKVRDAQGVFYFYTNLDGSRGCVPHINPKTLQALISNKIIVRQPNQYDWYSLREAV